ncbi:spermidine hydroxycinnamoyl transferase-like [Gastrolobium bilobum]|uniref:spermidine hydroxycinnamoyl transferase-like n=1 Tax=Gastrolobium bilobum TaxID=150636 RepID=UPI002AB0A727|nr:spermidine hydroxycinnamoyl transferase-like [Gastrolobium bilobum]XP_061364405.1 spermidine hydroxycinnamoyl transferase-like [Gastrolobium bilobum]
MVTNIGSYTVIPNQPTPKGRLWLSDSDLAEHSPAYTPSIYVYKPKHNHHDVIERMRTSLSDILVYYYPVAGRLCWIDECGRMEVDCNAKGVTLLEAETTKTLNEYGDFSPTQPIKDLIPTIDYTQPIEELPLFLVQLTRFHGDQSLAIGVAISHLLCDGIGAIQFINSWAKLARGDTLAPHEMPILDRTILKFPLSPLAPRFDHPELKPPPFILGTFDCITEQKTTAASLKLTSEEVEKLKKKANDQSQKDGSRPYTRYEAIAAHIWRCASKARELDDNQPTLARIIADIRSRLNPPLPHNYFGNALARTVTPTCYIGEIISNPLSYAAKKIREALDLLTNEYVRSQQDVIFGQEQLDSLRGFFFRQGVRRTAPYYGNPNIFIVSWMSMSVYEADFGWGKPVYFGEGFVSPYDTARIVQSPEGDGSVIVSMHFQIEHIQLFKKFFYEDI